MAFELRQPNLPSPSRTDNAEALDFVNRTGWGVSLKGESKRLYRAENPQLTYPAPAAAFRGFDGPYQVCVPQTKMEALSRLESPIPFECYPLKGKTVSETGIPGQILRLGKTEAEVALSRPVAPRTNLRILLTSDKPVPAGELYAKVTSRSDVDAKQSSGATRLRFTWVPEDVKQFFANQR